MKGRYFKTLVYPTAIKSTITYTFRENKFILILKSNSYVEIYQFQSGKASLYGYKKFDFDVLDCGFLPNRNTIILLGVNGHIRFIDPSSFVTLDDLKLDLPVGEDEKMPRKLMVDPHGITFCAYGYDSSLFLFRLMDEGFVHEYYEFENNVIWKALFVDSFRLVLLTHDSFDNNFYLNLINHEDGNMEKLRMPSCLKRPQEILSIDFSADSYVFLSSTNAHFVKKEKSGLRVTEVIEFKPQGPFSKLLTISNRENFLLGYSEKTGEAFGITLAESSVRITSLGLLQPYIDLCSIHQVGDFSHILSTFSGQLFLMEFDEAQDHVSVGDLLTPNMAPINDMIMLDKRSENASTLAIASGLLGHGCLYTINSGIGVDILTKSPTAEFGGFSNIWVVESLPGRLIIAFGSVDQTYFFSVEGESLIEISEDFPEFFNNECPALSVASLDKYMILVNSSKICVADLEQQVTAEEKLDSELSLASIHGNILLATLYQKNELYAYKIIIENNEIALKKQSSSPLSEEASCLSFCGSHAAVGTFDAKIMVYKLNEADLLEIASVSTYNGEIVESLMFISHRDSSYIFVGLRDGSISSYTICQDEIVHVETHSWGKFPMKLVPTNDTNTLIAISNNTWKLTLEKFGYKMSRVMCTISSIAPLPVSGFPNTYIAISEGHLAIVSLENRDVRIKKISEVKFPRRLMHETHHNSILVYSELNDFNGELFRLDCINSRQPPTCIKAFRDETVHCIRNLGDETGLVIMGTSFRSFASSLVRKGRLLALDYFKQDDISVLHEFSGPVAVCEIFSQNKILIGHKNVLSVFFIFRDAEKRLECKKISSLNLRWDITCVSIHNDYIAIGSQNDGISAFSYDSVSNNFNFIAGEREFNTPIDCLLTEDLFCYSVDIRGRIYGLDLKKSLIHKTIETCLTREFCFSTTSIGRKLCLVQDSKQKTIVVATIDGGLYALGEISHSDFYKLKSIEKVLPLRSIDVGQSREEGSIIDGDILCKYLDISEEEQKRIFLQSSLGQSEELADLAEANKEICDILFKINSKIITFDSKLST